jgi:hypothetical protein
VCGLSRKLDTWIAENLFDIEVSDYDEIEEYCPVMRIGMSLKYKEIPYYSTEIGPAWDVVNKLISERCRVSFLCQDSYYYADIETKKSGYPEECLAEVSSDTASMVICLAAYKAKTGEDWIEQRK